MRKLFSDQAEMRKLASQAAYICLAMALAFAVAGIFISRAGIHPLSAYGAMLKGAFTRIQGISEVCLKAAPIILIGLGICISLSGGCSSLGGDGQLMIGALAATMTSVCLDGVLPYWLISPLVFLAGALGGGLWGSIAGFLKVKFGMSTIIVTIMLNYIAANLINFLVEGPLKGPGSYIPQTATIPKALWLAPIFPKTRINYGFIIALFLAILVYIMLKKSVLGYRICALGKAPRAAEYAGVPQKRYTVLLMFAAGAFSGLAGVVEVLGVHFRVLDGISSGYGYLGISAALLAMNNPLALVFTSVFFGALKVGANSMQVQMQIPTSIVNVTQGLIILFIMIGPGFSGWFSTRLAKLNTLWHERKGSR